jgi:cell division septation protein DedD
VAAVIVNDPLWRIRATWLGREAMRLALERLPKPPEAVAEKAVTPATEPTAANPAPSEPQVAQEPEGEEVEEGTDVEMTAPAGVAMPPQP